MSYTPGEQTHFLKTKLKDIPAYINNCKKYGMQAIVDHFLSPFYSYFKYISNRPGRFAIHSIIGVTMLNYLIAVPSIKEKVKKEQEKQQLLENKFITKLQKEEHH